MCLQLMKHVLSLITCADSVDLIFLRQIPSIKFLDRDRLTHGLPRTITRSLVLLKLSSHGQPLCCISLSNWLLFLFSPVTQHAENFCALCMIPECHSIWDTSLPVMLQAEGSLSFPLLVMHTMSSCGQLHTMSSIG